jgi:chitinase
MHRRVGLPAFTLGLLALAVTAAAAIATVTYKVDSDWGTGFGASTSIKNTSASTITAWQLEFDYPHNITSIWDARVSSRVGNHYTLAGAGWNNDIPAGGTVSFGWNGTPVGPLSNPTNCKLNGQPVDSTTCVGGGGGDTTAPSVPAGLNSPSQTSSSIALAWTASTDNTGGSGVAGYDVYRNGAIVGSPTTNSFTDAGLAASTSYSYRVRARDNAGNASAQGTALAVSTKGTAACSTLPSVPTGLSSPSKTDTSVSLAWNASTPGANCTVQYRVFRGGTQAAQVATTSTTVGGLSPSTTYSFTVAAVNEFGSSAQSGALSVTTNAPPPPSGKKVVGYFAQWGIYGRNYHVKNIDTSGSGSKLTQINYAFWNVTSDGHCSTQDSYADYDRFYDAASSVDGVADSWDAGSLRGSFNQLRKLKAKYPQIKVVISLGGWTLSGGFSQASATAASRQALAADCINKLVKGNFASGLSVPGVFDGIDIDWEYPAACGLQCGPAADTENFRLLLAEFRRQLDAYRPGLLLTVAAPAGIEKIALFGPPEAIAPYLDHIAVMTYDFHGAWEATTNFHSALYGSSTDPSTGDARNYNTDFAIREYLRRGVPANKLVVGIGFYGRGWTNVPNVNNGLYQNGSAAPGTYEAGIEDYKVLKNFGGTSFRHAEAQAFWKFNGSTFWTYDDPTSVTNKMSYAKGKGLGGAMFWELSGDDSGGALITAIKNGLQ